MQTWPDVHMAPFAPQPLLVVHWPFTQLCPAAHCIELWHWFVPPSPPLLVTHWPFTQTWPLWQLPPFGPAGDGAVGPQLPIVAVHWPLRHTGPLGQVAPAEPQPFCAGTQVPFALQTSPVGHAAFMPHAVAWHTPFKHTAPEGHPAFDAQ